MAFAYTQNPVQHGLGNVKVVTGTWTNGGGDSGGAIVMPFDAIDVFVPSNASSSTQTYSISTKTVTLTTAAGDDGYYLAIGH